MNRRNADNVHFPTIEPHRRCDSEAELLINVCFTWIVASNAPPSHRQKREQDVKTIHSDQISLSKHPHTHLPVNTLN